MTDTALLMSEDKRRAITPCEYGWACYERDTDDEGNYIGVHIGVVGSLERAYRYLGDNDRSVVVKVAPTE